MKQTKTILSMLCAAALFAACSSTDELEPVVQTGQQTAEEAVGFDVYTRGTQTTRAGYVGEMDLTALRVAGFGVYAYVGKNGGSWSSAGSSWTPDFMANQQVAYAAGAWSYSPLKYWPNQANVADGVVDNATGKNSGANIDYVSFFAYAPYVDIASVKAYTTDDDITAALAGTNDGIVALPANNAQGDPKVGYVVVTNPVNSVDLMYGVAARKYTTQETTGNQGTAVEKDNPFLDMTKEVVADKINYNFKHALTKLSVNVDAFFDQVRTADEESTKDVDPNTRIVIDEILLGTGNVSLKGTLNLNNYAATPTGKPNWAAGAALADFPLQIAPSLKYVSGNEGSVTYFAQQPLGVTKKKQSVLGYAVDGTTPASLMFVPKDDDQTVNVKITYHVITRDARLTTGYNDVTNVISNSIAAGTLTFDAGKAYTLNLHLGMTSVKMDAVITDWDNTNASESIDLPANVQVSSLTATTSVDAYGAITPGTITATLTGSVTPSATPGIENVYFTTDAAGNDVLPVTKPATTYYIPGNYTGADRDIYLWYGGASVKLTNKQAAIADGSDGVQMTANIDACKDGDKIVAAGGSVVLTVTVNSTNVKDFNLSDWSVKQQIGDGDLTNATVTSSTTTPSITFTVTAPSNTSAQRTLTFILKHKDGMEVKATTTQVAGS